MSRNTTTLKKRIQREFRHFAKDICCHWQNPTAVTLTLRRCLQEMPMIAISPTDCSKNLRHFLNLLDRAAFRNARRKQRVPCIPVLEQMQDGRYHYHLALDRPASIGEFQFVHGTVPRLWRRTWWGDEQVLVKPFFDDGWLDYISKLRSKPSFADALDWENVRHDEYRNI